MNGNSQKKVFLDGEGNEWYRRNRHEKNRDIVEWGNSDRLVELLESLPLEKGPEISVLEIGCGQGLRLERLKISKGWTVTGIDPSEEAIEVVNASGARGIVGTADSIKMPDQSIDLLIFGFCLYLCDRSDLFEIAKEAHRVMKKESWLAILDFWSPNLVINDYHHKKDIKSYKDNLPAMFTWHPSYIVTDHCLRHHSTKNYTDDAQEWVAATIIRRKD